MIVAKRAGFGDIDGEFEGPHPYRYGRDLPIAQNRLPAFNVTSSSMTARRLDENEQSTSGGAMVARVNEAVAATFRKIRGAPFNIPQAANAGFAPAVLGRGGRHIRTGDFKSVRAMFLRTPTAPSIFRSIGPGLTPPSPFRYGSAGPVLGAVPVGQKKQPSPFTGRITPMGASRSSIIWGE